MTPPGQGPRSWPSSWWVGVAPTCSSSTSILVGNRSRLGRIVPVAGGDPCGAPRHLDGLAGPQRLAGARWWLGGKVPPGTGR